MKKTVILSALLLSLICSSASAQLLNGYGIKIGGTMANQDWDTKSDLTGYSPAYRMGFNGGAFAEFLDIPLFGIITEVNYNQKGTKLDIPITTPAEPEGTGESMEISNRIDYLSLLIAGKIKFTTPVIKPYIFAGPRVDIYLTKNTNKNFDDIYDDFENQIFGLSVGIGTELDTPLPVGFLVELQYNHDLTFAYESDLYDIKNRSFDLKVGIKL